jgi:hypothetical protein
MNGTTMRRPTSDDRWRTAEDHILNMPRTTEDDHAEEHELAARTVHRIAGHHAPELLEILGLTPATKTPDTRTKRCTRCQQHKPRIDFYKRPDSRDGLTSQCKTCHNRSRNAVRTRREESAA